MRNLADYSLYKCPFIHVEKECGHKLEGPEGYEGVYGIWCACGFRGPVLILEPEYLKLEKCNAELKGGTIKIENLTNLQAVLLNDLLHLHSDLI